MGKESARNLKTNMAAINKRVTIRRWFYRLLFFPVRLHMRLRKTRMKYKKSLWIRKIFEEREEKSEYFFKMFRMSPQKFELLLS